MQHGEAVPAVVAGGAGRDLRGKRQHLGPVRPRDGALADDDQRPLALRQAPWRSHLPAAKLGQRLRAGAEVLVGIGEVGRLADEADPDVALAPALADAGIEHRRFVARVGADDEDRVGLLDAGDGRVEDVGGAAERRHELAALAAAIEILHAERRHQLAGARRSPRRRRGRRRSAPIRSAVVALTRLGDRRRTPRARMRRHQHAVPADVGPVEPLRAQPVPDEARLVRDPLLVHRLVEARQDAHDLAVARVDADRRADRVHHVDRLGLDQLPRPRLEGVGREVSAPTGQRSMTLPCSSERHRAFEIGGDLHVLAAAGGAEIRRRRRLRRRSGRSACNGCTGS